MKNLYSDFTKQYSLSKTLRFELKPVGETADYIEQYGSEYLKEIVKGDEKRADDYKKVKQLIDDYHRDYINQCLGNDGKGLLGHPRNTITGEEVITKQQLESAFSQYQTIKKAFTNVSDKNKALKEWEKTQEALRKSIVKAFVAKKDLSSKKMITELLPEYLKEKNQWEENKEIVESFNKFTTYFNGFHTNRENMYADENKATSIANRSINENLPRFFENLIFYKKIKNSEHEAVLEQAESLLKLVQVKSFDEVFTPSFYLKLFTQQGIEAYKKLIGGQKADDQVGLEEIIGLNQIINQYKQQYNANKPEQNLTGKNFPTFTSPHNQILAESSRQAYSYEPYTTDAELFSDLGELIQDLDKNKGWLSLLQKTIASLIEIKPEYVFIRSNAISQLSHAWLGNYGAINHAYKAYIQGTAEYQTAKKKDKDKDKDNALKLLDADNNKTIKLFTFKEIDSWLNQHPEENNEIIQEALSKKGNTVAKFLINSINNALQNDNGLHALEEKVSNIIKQEQLDTNRRPPKTHSETDQGGEGYHQVGAIQKLLETYLTVANIVKPLHLVHGRKPIELPETMDVGFYNELAATYELINDNLQNVLNKARNYLTKKRYNNEKVKINFNKPTFLDSWHKKKLDSSKVMLLRKEQSYYLAIINGKTKDIIETLRLNGGDKLHYERMVYSQIANPSKDVQNLMVIDGQTVKKNGRKDDDGVNRELENLKNKFLPPDINAIRKAKSYSRQNLEEFSKEHLETYISYYKERTIQYFTDFDFQFKESKSYRDFMDFTNHINEQAYQLKFEELSAKVVDRMIKDKKLFLFQIYNKDFSPHSKGTPNLHTLYWKGLFDPHNLKDVVLKLNGEAEMFFRRHSIKKEQAITHKAGEGIDRKNSTNTQQKSQFVYDIVKDRRYTKDKFFLHVPITLNHKAKGLPKFNDAVNKAINENTRIIGIDRGERHLLYYCVIDQNGNIVKNADGTDCQGTLNTIQPANKDAAPVNYHQLLDNKEKQRDAARKGWTSIENIKELKSGYLSQVVHKITQLMTEHNAIVCLEDLNAGFKRGRFKVEKQVYQNFEKALIEKLNYLVDKKQTDPSKPQHYLNALQLTDKFVSFEKMGKQNGALYYVRADYTSKICPQTGFINLLNPKYQSRDKSRSFFSNFDCISFNGENFEFAFNYKKTNPDRKLQGAKMQWTVTSHGERLTNKRNDQGIWETHQLLPTKVLQSAFELVQIDYANGDNLIESILEQENAEFFKQLMWGLRLSLQMRNSRSNSTAPEDDYLISPIANKDGGYYDSRNTQNGDGLPKDADANGAYHIALKGLWNVQQIQQVDGSSEKPNPNLAMKNEDWFAFVQSKNYKNT